MSLLTFTPANRYTKLLLFSVILLSSSAFAEGWKFDFSRREKDLPKQDLQTPDAPGKKPEPSLMEAIFPAGEPMQEVVIMNTEKGFVPATVRVRQGLSYKIYIVNVNEKEKNVSFVLDSFTEHHATYYGKIKTFMIKPKQEGIFTFNSPETSAQGRLVVYPANPSVDVRLPASQE